MTIWLELSKRPRKDGRIYSGNQIVLHAGSEDVLTANVFGIIKNLDHDNWLRSFLRRTLKAESTVEFQNPRFSFWKRHASPDEYAGKEGASEIDVTIECDDAVVFVEAKYRARLATGTTHDKERDQIIRNLDVGLSYAHKKNKRFFLLILTDENKPPELYTYYKEHLYELEKKLPYRKGLNLANCLAWANWSEIANSLGENLGNFSKTERRFVTDLNEYLRLKLQTRALKFQVVSYMRKL